MKKISNALIALVLLAVIAGCGFYMYTAGKTHGLWGKAEVPLANNIGRKPRLSPEEREKRRAEMLKRQEIRRTANQGKLAQRRRVNRPPRIPDSRYLKPKVIEQTTESDTPLQPPQAFAIDEDVTVAIMPETEGDMDVLRAISEIETGLSKDDKIALVDREHIVKTLKEHALSASSAAQNQLTVGNLLGAKLLVFVERVGNKDFTLLNLKAIETASGIQVHSLHTFNDKEAFLPASLTAIRLAIKKCLTPVDKRVFVASLGFHSSDPGTALGGLPEALGTVLLGDIGNSPGVVVLERERLQELMKEAGLTRLNQQIMTSSVYLEGGIKRAQGDDLEITLQIKDRSEKVIKSVTVTGTREEFNSLRNQLVTQIASELNTGKVYRGYSTPSQEGYMYLKRAKIYSGHGDLERARAAMETAVALNPALMEQTRKDWQKIIFRAQAQVDRLNSAEQKKMVLIALRAANSELEVRTELRRQFINQYLAALEEYLKENPEMANLNNESRLLLRPLEPMRVHHFFRGMTNTNRVAIRMRALGSDEAWTEWMRLLQYYIDDYRRTLAYNQRVWEHNGDSRPWLNSIEDAIGDSKYWTEDPKEWYAMLQEIIATLDNPPVKDTKEPVTILSRIWAFRNVDPNSSGTVTTPFREPGNMDTAVKFADQLIKRPEPLAQLVGYDLKLRCGPESDVPTFAKQELDHFLNHFTVDDLINEPQTYGFIPTAIQRALWWVNYGGIGDSYYEKIVDQMFEPKFAHTLTAWDTSIRRQPMYIIRIYLNKLKYSDPEKADRRSAVCLEILKSIPRGEITNLAKWIVQFRQNLGTDPTKQPQAKAPAEKPQEEMPKLPPIPRKWNGFQVKEMSPPNAGAASGLRVNLFRYSGSITSGGRVTEILNGENVYIFSSILSPLPTVSLAKLTRSPINGEKETLLGQLIIPRDNVPYNAAIAFPGDDVVVALYGTGLIHYTGTSAKIWNEASGLPSNYLTAVAAYGNRLFVGTGQSIGVEAGGSVFEFDLNNGKNTMICSSRSVQKKNPLDGGEAYTVDQIAADPDNGCLWLGLAPPTASGHSVQKGIWKYSFADGTIERAPNNFLFSGRNQTAEAGNAIVPAKDRVPAVLGLSPNLWPSVPGKNAATADNYNTLKRFSGMTKTRPFPLKYLPSGKDLYGAVVIGSCTEGVLLSHFHDRQYYLFKPMRGDKLDKGWQQATAGYDQKRVAAWAAYTKAGQLFYRGTRKSGNPAYLREAIDYMTKALETLKDQPDIRLKRSTAYYLIGDFASSMADADRVLALNPQCGDAHFNKCFAYVGQGNLEAAMTELQMAEALLTDSITPRLCMANILQIAGKYDDAMAHYKKVLERSPSYGLALGNMGLIYLKQNDPENAAIYFEKARIANDNRMPLGQTPLYQFSLFMQKKYYPAFMTGGRHSTLFLGQYLAKIWDGEDATSQLESYKTRLAEQSGQLEVGKIFETHKWPYPIVQLYSGEITPEECVKRSQDPQNWCGQNVTTPVLGTYTFVGMWYLKKGQKEKAAEMFKLAVDTGQTNYKEYILSTYELSKLVEQKLTYPSCSPKPAYPFY